MRKTQRGTALFYLSISETHDLLARFSLIIRSGEEACIACPCKESWPEEKCPGSEEEWQQIIQYFLQGIEQACAIAQTVQLDKTLEEWPGETPGGVLRNIASHNSYHLGEIVLIHRLFSAWPPPTGGYPV